MPSERWRINKRQKRVREIKEGYREDPADTVATMVVMVEELADSFEKFRKKHEDAFAKFIERHDAQVLKDDVRQATTEGQIVDLTTSFNQHADTPKAHDKTSGDGNGKDTVKMPAKVFKWLIVAVIAVASGTGVASKFGILPNGG